MHVNKREIRLNTALQDSSLSFSLISPSHELGSQLIDHARFGNGTRVAVLGGIIGEELETNGRSEGIVLYDSKSRSC
jgi:hypothetical protein